MWNGNRTARSSIWASALLLSALTLLAGCSPDEGANRDFSTTPTLRELADARGILIGTAVNPELLADDARYAEIVATQFNSVTAENGMKWKATEAEHGVYTWADADAVAAFALANGQTIRGHTLVWPNEYQYQATPDYVRTAPDPATMQQYIDDHIDAVVSRYADAVDRWDVINEPLVTLGSTIDENALTSTLGEGWIVRAFQQVRALDPSAKLYVNEALAERPGSKHQGLLTLVERLLTAGAPIDGVGLQGHFLLGTPTTAELIEVMEDWEALGLEVAITELDIPSSDEEAQASQYADIMNACLAAAACREVTFWGFTDRHTWLDSFLGPESDPLLFDEDYLPKPAYGAVSAALTAPALP